VLEQQQLLKVPVRMVQMVQIPQHLGLLPMVAVVAVEQLAELDEMVHLAVEVVVGVVLLLVEKVFTLAQLILMRLDKDMMAEEEEVLDLVIIPEAVAEQEVLAQV